jgi:hypothetical protein
VLVRTRGYGGNRGDGRSWLLIKHRDEWSGDVDIVEFAPLSVKSERDFPEILAADNPDVWRSNRPAEGGETGATLRQIIEQAAALKAGKPGGAVRAAARPAKTAKRTAPSKNAKRPPSKTAKTSKAATSPTSSKTAKPRKIAKEKP